MWFSLQSILVSKICSWTISGQGRFLAVDKGPLRNVLGDFSARECMLYMYIYIYMFSDEEKHLFLELKVSFRFIDSLQPTNSNVKLSQCQGIFLTSLNYVRNNLLVKTTSYRNQSIDLFHRSIYCFRCDKNLH